MISPHCLRPPDFIFPFPPAIANPNKNGHWRNKNTARQAYKQACIIECRGAATRTVGVPYQLILHFYPARAAGDLDNMLASMKGGLDGLAHVLGIDDKQFRPITIDSPGPDAKNPRVEIWIN